MLPEVPQRAVLEHAVALVRSVGPMRIPTLEGVAVGYDNGDFVILGPA